MRLFKKLITRFFFALIDPRYIISKINEIKIHDCIRQVELGINSRFYENATVFNLSGDKSKIKIGNGTHIRGELFLFSYSNGIEIGDNSYLGPGSIIRSGQKIIIGNNVLISHYVTIIDSDSHEINYKERASSYISMVKYGHAKENLNVKTSAITIEDHAWISYNVCILKGVRIGKGAIIGAGSVVTHDVPDFTFFAGNPAKYIKDVIQ